MTTTMTYDERIERGETVAEAIEAETSYSARVWTQDERGYVRVYVSRMLSRGRQDMGYLEIGDDGEISANGVSRNRSAVRDVAVAALREQTETKPAESTPAPARQHVVACCSACGDHVPLTRTPRGWLCYDCAEAEA